MKEGKSTMIFEHIHRLDGPQGKGRKIGTLVAKQEGDSIIFGWSRCNTRAGDQFNVEDGVKAALNNLGCPIPVSFRRRKELSRFRGRAARYFPKQVILPWETAS